MLLIIILFILVLIVSIIVVYNGLVKDKLRVDNAWAQIDTQLKRRFDLIPNLVETVKGYATHESETLEKVTAARNLYASASNEKDKLEADNMLAGTLKSIFALSENYPDLKASGNFKALQDELSAIEEKIAYSRQFFNDAVQQYNMQRSVFPKNIIAGMFGFKERAFFEIKDEVQREAVKVQF